MENLNKYVEEKSYEWCYGIRKFQDSNFLNHLLDIIDEQAKTRRLFLSSVRITDNYIKVICCYGIKEETTCEYDFYIDLSKKEEVFDKLLQRILTSSYKKKECSIFDITCFNEESNYEIIITLKNNILNNITISIKYSRINELLCALELFRRKAQEYNNNDLEIGIRKLDRGTLEERFSRGAIKLTIN